MATITLKNVPQEVHAALKQRAKRHKRSLNQEAIVCLDLALGRRSRDPDAMLEGIRALRSRVSPKEVDLKNQTTLSAEVAKRLNLLPGIRFRQTVEGNRIIIEPIDDVSTAFGALKSKRKFRSVAEETEGMEAAVGREGAKSESNG